MGPAEFITKLRQGKLGPAYFLRGPDRFLHEECRHALLASVPAEAREWCLAQIEFQPGRLAPELEAADQMPMLGGRSLLIFSDPEDFKSASDEDYEALRGYLERPSPFATVVFAAAEPDRRRRFVQLLEKQAEVIEMRPLPRREAALWAQDYLRRAGVEIDPRLAEELAARFEVTPEGRGENARAGVNLLWMRTELEKLLAAKPGAKRLEATDLDLIVSFREEHEIGRYLRALAERQCAEAIKQLRALLASRVAATLVLWCVGDLVRHALRGARQEPFGRGRWSSGPNPFSTFEIAAEAARRYTRAELLRALRLVRSTDLGIKSSWKDSNILLELLTWQIVVGKGAAGADVSGEEVTVGSADE
jgi:DNA polymerase III delta subunit